MINLDVIFLSVQQLVVLSIVLLLAYFQKLVCWEPYVHCSQQVVYKSVGQEDCLEKNRSKQRFRFQVLLE